MYCGFISLHGMSSSPTILSVVLLYSSTTGITCLVKRIPFLPEDFKGGSLMLLTLLDLSCNVTQFFLLVVVVVQRVTHMYSHWSSVSS